MMLKILLISAGLMMCVLSVSGQFTPLTNASVNNRRRAKNRHGSTNASTPEVPSAHDSEDETHDEPASNAMITLLHKINDRLTAMSAVNEQQIRKLETFEYRLTKLEVQIQEKTDGLRSDLKEVSRRVQQIDWQSSKTESSLDSLKTDTTFLKQAVEHSRLLPVQGSNLGTTSDLGVDVSNKLQMTMRGVQSVLNTISNMQYEVSGMKRNLTKISNSWSMLNSTLPQLLSTKHFQRSLAELDRRAYRPVCGVSQSTADRPDGRIPRDCSEVTGTKSGVYRIQPPQAAAPFFVYCDLGTNGGGWTVLQRRQDGTLDFYKGWHDYKHGFGNIGGEFWLGLEKIHLLTNFKVNEIYIELENFALEKSYAKYSAFAVGAEVEGYPISFLSGYEGTAGDSLLYHAGQKFSTNDVDHDNWPEGNCAQSHTGAWWYNGCDTSNLNGRYLNGELPDQYEYQGMYWYEWQGPKYSLKSSKIMVRPFNESSSRTPTTTEFVPAYSEENCFEICFNDLQ